MNRLPASRRVHSAVTAQLSGRSSNERRLWSIGATFYHMLIGQFPRDFIKGRDPMDVLLNDEVIPTRKRDRSIPKEVAQVIDRAIRNNPKDRYSTSGAMLEDLKQALFC
jgi:serine/threonine protein kinase